MTLKWLARTIASFVVSRVLARFRLIGRLMTIVGVVTWVRSRRRRAYRLTLGRGEDLVIGVRSKGSTS